MGDIFVWGCGSHWMNKCISHDESARSQAERGKEGMDEEEE